MGIVVVADLAASAAGSEPAKMTATRWRANSGRLPRQAIVVALRPAVFDGDGLALDISRLTQGLAQRGQTRRVVVPRLAAEISDHRHRRLLPTRGERPRRRSGAEERDDIAPFHGFSQRPRITDEV
jgi:hypothetical protein